MPMELEGIMLSEASWKKRDSYRMTLSDIGYRDLREQEMT